MSAYIGVDAMCVCVEEFDGIAYGYKPTWRKGMVFAMSVERSILLVFCGNFVSFGYVL